MGRAMGDGFPQGNGLRHFDISNIGRGNVAGT
jgi:hypothetical protein